MSYSEETSEGLVFEDERGTGENEGGEESERQDDEENKTSQMVVRIKGERSEETTGP